MKILKSSIVAAAGAIVLFTSIFLTWVSISSLGMNINLSLWDMVDVKAIVSSWNLLGYTLYLIPLATIACLVAAFLAMRKKSNIKAALLIYIISVFVSSFVLVYVFLKIKGFLSTPYFGKLASAVNYGWGFWLSIVGILIILAANVLAFLEARKLKLV